MSLNCFTAGVQRQGTSQVKRLPEGLKEKFVQIDERDFNALLEFTKETANLYNYYDPTNTPNGGWKEFFTQQLDEAGYTAPHFALFAAFLELFAIAQADLNTLGTKHLEFFYRDVLGFAENEAIPDQVYLIGQLAKHIAAVELEEGTLFKTGEKVNGVEKLYALTDDFSLNKTSLTSICSIYAKNTRQLFTSAISNSNDGKGEELANEESGWLPFGDESREETPFGFAIESPTLRMAEGVRIVTLTFELETNISNPTPQLLAITDFIITATGEKGWIEQDLTAALATGADGAAGVQSATLSGATFTIKFGFSKAAKAIIDYDSKTHGEGFDAKYPCLKITFAKGTTNAAFEQLKTLNIKNVSIQVDVTGLKTLILQNEQGVLDPAKPMQPFGARPVIGSRFYVGSNEAFSKKITQVKASFKWRNLPAVKFGDYHANFHSATVKPKTNDYNVKPYLLSGNDWDDGTAVSMFESTDIVPTSPKTWVASGFTTSTIDPDTDAGKRYATTSNRGYLAFELNSYDFLHDEYQLSYGKGIILGLAATDKTKQLDYVPNNPYTPEFEELYLTYTATETIELLSSPTSKFFHCGPFGSAQQNTTSGGLQVKPLLPTFSNKGELYLGFENCVPPQSVNLLFQLAEGSSNPEADTAVVEWSYLSNNQWVNFTDAQLQRENTNGLLKTGIVTLSLPSTANAGNTLMPADKIWVRLSVAANADAVCKIIQILPQAIQAEFYPHNGLEATGETLAAKTISKLFTPNSSVKGVSQPYASFGGAAQESGSTFYVRVSERLRHKKRAITIWDYERLILQNFTGIHRVKAINHTYYSGADNGYKPLAPGYVTVVMVPDTYNQNALDPLKPKVSKSTLEDVKAYLATCTTPHAKIEVQNPIYEEVEVRLQVRFYDGEDVGICLDKLHEKITEFLAPWAYNSDAELLFGTTIHKSNLIYHIEQLEYVDFVQCVEMHIHAPAWLNVNANADTDTAEATTAASVFTSYATHTLTPLEGSGCFCSNCGSNLVYSPVFNELEECGCNK